MVRNMHRHVRDAFKNMAVCNSIDIGAVTLTQGIKYKRFNARPAQSPYPGQFAGMENAALM